MNTTTYKQVRNCLEQVPATRNSDKVLMIEVWRLEGLFLSPAQEDLFMQVSSPETIRRNRQKIQEAGYFPSNKQVQQRRKELEYQHKSQIVTDKTVPKAISWLND